MTNISVQCRLKRGNSEQIVWIPSAYAIKNKFLKLKDRISGIWEDGWKVVDTYSRLETQYVHDVLGRVYKDIHKPSLKISKKGHK